eukprot:jgi/Chrzof1/11017/Cz05g20160.t1
MQKPHLENVAHSYLQICSEIGCQPVLEFLQCLENGSRACKLSRIDQVDQLYSTVSLLPYAELEEVDLSGLSLTSEGWIALMDACAKCTALQVLTLKGCALGTLEAGVQEQLADMLGACTVSVLDASQNGLGDESIVALCDTPLIQSGRLNVLDLSENKITCSAVALLAGTLQAAGGACPLKQLDMSFNQIGDKGACAISSMLSSVPLLALELEGNQIGDVGGLALASALKRAPLLQRLNLNHNRFTAQTLAALADAIRLTSGSLQELAVAFALGGGKVAAADVLRAAASSTQLQLLDIRGIPLEQQAIDELCHLLAAGTPLVTLRADVSSKEAAEQVARALTANSSIMHLMLGGPVPEHVLSFIGATLSSNTLCRMSQDSSSHRAACGSDMSTPHCWPAATRSASNHSIRPPPAAGCFSPNSSSGPSRPRSAGSNSRTRAVTRTLTMQAKRLSVLDPVGLAGLAGGGAATKASEVFRRHDGDNSGHLDAEEMMSALLDLGMLDGMKARQLGKFLSTALKEADTDQDGRINLPDFIKYYERLARYYAESARQGRIHTRRKPLVVPLEAAADPALKKVFKAYCRLRVGQGRQVGASVQHMNAAQLNVMCRDAGLVEPTGPLSQCAVDIVFTRSKPPGSRRLSFKEFLEAVTTVAEEAGCGFGQVIAALSSITSPVGEGPPSSQRPGSAPTVTSFNISDLTDHRVGPVLPTHSAAPNSEGPSQRSAWSGSYNGVRHIVPTPPVGGTPHAVAGSSVRYAGSLGTNHVVRSLEPSYGSSAAVQNPLYEGETGNSNELKRTAGSPSTDAQAGSTKLLEARLHRLEQQLAANQNATKSAASGKQGSGEVLSRLTALEGMVSSRQQQWEALAHQQATLQTIVKRLTDQAPSNHRDSKHVTADVTDKVQTLAQQLQQLSMDVARMDAAHAGAHARLQGSSEDSLTAYATTELLNAVERKLTERQNRIESALMQVARQVDVLDVRLKDEQESSLKALEAILANASPTA